MIKLVAQKSVIENQRDSGAQGAGDLARGVFGARRYFGDIRRLDSDFGKTRGEWRGDRRGRRNGIGGIGKNKTPAVVAGDSALAPATIDAEGKQLKRNRVQNLVQQNRAVDRIRRTRRPFEAAPQRAQVGLLARAQGGRFFDQQILSRARALAPTSEQLARQAAVASSPFDDGFADDERREKIGDNLGEQRRQKRRGHKIAAAVEANSPAAVITANRIVKGDLQKIVEANPAVGGFNGGGDFARGGGGSGGGRQGA